MSKVRIPKLYIYVIARDFGFAPNPFHGICTLATCKPRIRNTARIGDWVIGVGGSNLKASGRCILAMKISQKITFNEYWDSEEFQCKKPVRNGTKKTMVGDNIYFESEKGVWHQAHSHHSMKDGSVNEYNLKRDTSSKYVLISNHFYYFGRSAPIIPEKLLLEIGYKNRVNHRVFSIEETQNLLDWLENEYSDSLNKVKVDPFNFDKSEYHYSVDNDRITP